MRGHNIYILFLLLVSPTRVDACCEKDICNTRIAGDVSYDSYYGNFENIYSGGQWQSKNILSASAIIDIKNKSNYIEYINFYEIRTTGGQINELEIKVFTENDIIIYKDSHGSIQESNYRKSLKTRNVGKIEIKIDGIGPFYIKDASLCGYEIDWKAIQRHEAIMSIKDRTYYAVTSRSEPNSNYRGLPQRPYYDGVSIGSPYLP